jgi:hypothetical protein
MAKKKPVTKVVPPGESWRDYLKIHPEADRFPLLTKEKLLELGNDIKTNGQRLPARVGYDEDGKTPVLVDGRTRLDAREAVGLPIDFNDPATFQKVPLDVDLVAEIRSLNVHRRHLDRQWIDDYLAGKIKANPGKSNRAIAAEAVKDGVKVDHKKVAREREQLESTGAVAPVEETTGRDGKRRKQPAAKKGKGKGASAPKPQPPEITLSTTEYAVVADPPTVEPKSAPAPEIPAIAAEQAPAKPGSVPSSPEITPEEEEYSKTYHPSKLEAQVDRFVRHLIASDLEAARELHSILSGDVILAAGFLSQTLDAEMGVGAEPITPAEAA